jgi:hypothetical protein
MVETGNTIGMDKERMFCVLHHPTMEKHNLKRGQEALVGKANFMA